ncbi:MAG: response regulator [Myxococcales bacterium]|nr:response regulator [Myxococcales bacterium]
MTNNNLTVLIIDDDEVAAEIIQKFVHHKMPTANIEWCWNGYEALVRVEQLNPDLIFLDYMMPKLDGMSFLRGLKQLESASMRHVAIISAFVDDRKKQDFMDLGANFVLAKPISVDQIHQVLDKVVRSLKPQKKI